MVYNRPRTNQQIDEKNHDSVKNDHSGPRTGRTLLAIPGPQDPFEPGPMVDVPLAGPILRGLAAGTHDSVILIGADTKPDPAGAGLRDAISHRFPDVSIHTVLPDALTGSDSTDFLVSGPLNRQILTLGKIFDGRLNARPVMLTSEVLPPELVELAELVGRPIPLPRGSQEISNLVVREPNAGYATRSTRTSDTATRDRTTRIPAGPRRTNGLPEPQSVIRALGLIGQAPSFTRILDGATTLARHELPVLIQGETGTGKELVARMIHQLSARHREPFVAVNCGALPAQLIESILFGHKRGAFTGAQTDQSGKFELADGGTLFLDELGELPLELQPKLLRVLEDGVIEPLGASMTKTVNVRIVAATNLELGEALRQKKFREDLYYRLAAGIITLPALRDRPGDIPLIALHFLQQMNQSLAEPRQFSPGALDRLSRHAWKGNVRDLQNTISRSILWSVCPLLEAEDLIFDDPTPAEHPLDGLPTPEEGFSLEEFLAQARKQLMLRALDLADGNQSAAAKRLGISPQAVHKFLKQQ